MGYQVIMIEIVDVKERGFGHLFSLPFEKTQATQYTLSKNDDHCYDKRTNYDV